MAAVTNGEANTENLPWPGLHYQHTAATRAALMERYKPSMANKVLAALRGVLKECWRLGYMTAEEYHRAADVPTIKAQTLPRGRALASGEISALMGAKGAYVPQTGIMFIGIAGTVVALDRSTGAEVWRSNVGGDFVNVTLLDGDLFAAAKGKLFCLARPPAGSGGRIR